MFTRSSVRTDGRVPRPDYLLARVLGLNPVRRSPKSPMKTVFIGVLGCRCTRIRAETSRLEQVRLAVRLAVQARLRRPAVQLRQELRGACRLEGGRCGAQGHLDAEATSRSPGTARSGTASRRSTRRLTTAESWQGNEEARGGPSRRHTGEQRTSVQGSVAARRWTRSELRI